jgi:PPK2 family polyphosphate:nucleotide phosphotransferase
MKNLSESLLVTPGRKVRLSGVRTDDTAGLKDKEQGLPFLEKNLQRMGSLHYLLYAEARRSLLVVLQAMDAGGKDGTIRHVMTGLNPQGCRVTSFKKPSAEELAHDFLWRVHHAVPARGEIGVFNRSHYEDVLVVRVHGLVPKPVWKERYQQINEFEWMLHQNEVHILKFFLHISRREQTRRLRARLEDPTRQWKITEEDFTERELWSDYAAAYEAVLSKCSTPWAPWYIIPSDHKWFRDVAVSQIIADALEGLHMRFPKPKLDLSKMQL